MTIEEFNEKKKRIETMKQEMARTQGAYDQALSSLKSFGVSTIEEAESLVKEYRKRETRQKEELEMLLEEFEEASKTI